MRRLSEHPGIAALAIFGTVGCVVGWVASLVGPLPFVIFGILGFFCGCIGLVVSNRLQQQVGAENVDRLGRALRNVARTTAVVIPVSLICLIVTGLDGMGDLPAFETRSVYELVEHGRRTQVSRLHYILAGASFFTGWTGMALLANIYTLHRALYGGDPL